LIFKVVAMNFIVKRKKLLSKQKLSTINVNC